MRRSALPSCYVIMHNISCRDRNRVKETDCLSRSVTVSHPFIRVILSLSSSREMKTKKMKGRGRQTYSPERRLTLFRRRYDWRLALYRCYIINALLISVRLRRHDCVSKRSTHRREKRSERQRRLRHQNQVTHECQSNSLYSSNTVFGTQNEAGRRGGLQGRGNYSWNCSFPTGKRPTSVILPQLF